MAIGINDLDDDDIFEPQTEPFVQQQTTQTNPNEGEDDILSDFLKTKGIEDLSKIKFEDENGNIEERSWKSLTREEQFNILNTPLVEPREDNQNNFTDEELALINEIRNANLTPEQYIQQFQQQEVSYEPQYKIDDLSDDELYLLDLETRAGELTDDEAAQALNIAKQNEEFYKKQIAGIRKEYKEREDYLNQQEQARIEEEQKQAFEEYQSNVVSAIDNFNTIGNLDLNLEDADKDELADFMLSQDQSGKNYLYQALQDPETLVKAAWFILNGDEAFNSVADYYTNQIKLISDAQYKKGFEDAKKGNQPSRPTVVIDTQKNNNRHRTYNSIEDLDDDD